MRLKLVVVIIGMFIASVSYAKSPKDVQKEVNEAVNAVYKIYKKNGMSGLITYTTQCYEKTNNTEFRCVYIDLASRYIDQVMVEQLHFPPTEFYSDELFGPRIFAVFTNKNMNEDKSNEYLQAATPIVNKAVDKKLASK